MLVRAGDRIFDVDGIVFDKDGTLISLDSYWAAAARVWVDTVAEVDRDAVAEALGLTDVGLVPDGALATASIADLVGITADVLARRGAADPDAVAARAAERAGIIAAGADPEPIGDVRGAICRLADAGLGLAVATTDDTSAAYAALARLGVAERVAVVLGADDPNPVKPDAAVLVTIARRLGTTPDRLLMVGDSERDRATATNAGAAGFVLVADQPRIEADATVASIDGIRPVVVGS